MPSQRRVLNEALWVRSERSDRTQRNARSEGEALRARGARVFMFKGPEDRDGLEKLRGLLRQEDLHVVLARLLPNELAAVQPLLRERRNFSIIVEDWWIVPNWFMREADYILFRNFNGPAVRAGLCRLVAVAEPPFFLPLPKPVKLYGTVASLARPLSVLAGPFVDAFRGGKRRADPPTPERYIYFPFPVNGEDVPLKDEPVKYDFANTGGVCGVWIMRDPYSSFRHTFGNLYIDRQRLIDCIVQYEGNPFVYYDCMREDHFLPYDEYVLKSRQARYLITTGGLHNNSVPKFLEYTCLGIPLLGKRLPYEYPWLDDCMFDIDATRLAPEQAKPLLQQALAEYPRYKENCLKWRERLVELYNFNRIVDMAQAQIDGQAIPAAYLTKAGIAALPKATGRKP